MRYKDRETLIQRNRETKRETERQRDIKPDRQRQKERWRESERETEKKWKDRQRDRETERERKERERKTERQRERDERDKKRERQRDRETDHIFFIYSIGFSLTLECINRNIYQYKIWNEVLMEFIIKFVLGFCLKKTYHTKLNIKVKW